MTQCDDSYIRACEGSEEALSGSGSEPRGEARKSVENPENSSKCTYEHCLWVSDELQAVVREYVEVLKVLQDVRWVVGASNEGSDERLLQHLGEIKRKSVKYDLEGETCGWFH